MIKKVETLMVNELSPKALSRKTKALLRIISWILP